MYWIIIFISFLLLLALSQWVLAALKKKGIMINRWIWAFASFLIVIIPHLIAKEIPPTIDGILYVFCAVFALNFMIEQHAWYEKNNKFK